MRVLDDVVFRLRPRGVTRHSPALAQVREVRTSRQQLVHVALVTRIEHQAVIWRLEDPVKRERELDDAEVRSEMTTRA
jgi:hypothetical protein